jgi:hypothetical protein
MAQKPIYVQLGGAKSGDSAPKPVPTQTQGSTSKSGTVKRCGPCGH